MITYFKSINDTSTPYYVDISKAIERIKHGASKPLVEDVRVSFDKKERNERKKKLPAICFSGTFSSRADNAILEHSGYICIDFDGFDSYESMMDYRTFLMDDNYTYCVFMSPSGDGLKVIVKIPQEPQNHKKYFNALKDYYNREEFDVTCKNISRVCYESYDPDIYVNELSFMWHSIKDEEVYSKQVHPTLRVDNLNEIQRRLLLWWNKEYGLIPGKRNNNLFVLASALNEYGVQQSDARELLFSVDTSGEMHGEIPTIVNSAYKKVSSFNTKYFEDTEKKSEMVKNIKNGTEPVNDYVEVDMDEFWNISSKGKIEIVPHLFRDFLIKNGIHKYYPPGSQNFIFVKVSNNVISDINEDQIKDVVLDYLMEIDNMAVYNYFAVNTKFFQESFLNYVPKIKVKFMRDTQHASYLFYRNCTVKVTRDGIDTLDYSELDGCIWEQQKMNRDFVLLTEIVDCEYKRFISNVSGDDESHIRSMESTIGYLLHAYKPASYCPAVILNDEVISDNPEGGTGKGLYTKALTHMRKTVVIDGKGFSFQKSFPYQRVQVDTQLLVFDDVLKNFAFDRLFSLITEGITLEKKNKDEIKVEFEDSPKIIISTNYAIRGAGNSHDRRKWDLEFKQHYSKNYTPETEFGHMLFTGWGSEEWIKFDNYMISNIQRYLTNGLEKSKFKNLKTRTFIAETNSDFWEWCVESNLTKPNVCSYGKSLFDEFVSEYPDYGMYGRLKISQNLFYKWLDSYGIFAYGCKPEVTRDAIGKRFKFVGPEYEQTKLKF